ncbi:uncharacterized protein I303_105431 [Kwoniella dejecticola CBS 10117]|uniref:YTH domain-containing protein n=1 Tax=Kwoniella dejecticola CBS 10117 TaxID=1296121 RepID=A0AAJ8KS17_9TREE
MNPYNPDRPPPDFQPNLPSDRTGSEGDMRGAGAQFTGPSMQHPLTTHNEDGDIDFQRRMQNLEIDPTQPTYHPHQSPPEEQPYQPFPQTFYPPPHNLQYPAYSYSAYPGSSPINPSPVQPYGLWTSPPMSPAMSSTPYRPSGPPSAMHRHGSVGDYGAFYGTPRGSYSGGPPSTWTSPSMPSTYGFYTPQQQQQPTMEPRINDWGQAPPNYRGQAYRRDGRQSWSGPSRMTKEIAGPQEKEKEQERKAYHPQAPARRSDWVMWVGNVIRRKDDDLRSGVGAQRGTGMHRDWVKEQEVKLPRQTSTASVSSANSVPPSPAILEHPPEGEGRRRESIIKEGREPIKHHQSSGSFASTNSSFLARHFPKRIFILKSLTTAELEESVQTGTWKTQGHNEPILDQAFRTSQEVFLIFGANRSGEFFGYAKMIEPIDKDKDRAKKAQSHSLSKSRPPIAHAESESRPPFFLTPSQSHLASSSPGELTPNEEANLEHAIGARRTDPSDVRNKSPNNKSIQSAPEYRAQTLDPKALQHDYFPPVPITAANAGEGEAQHQEQLGGSQRQPSRDESGVLRKDTLLTPDEKAEREEEEGHDEFLEETRGHVFRIEWIKVGPVPFNKTRHLRNPWNADREVKVSRDGTEVEPTIGSALMAEWDRS